MFRRGLLVIGLFAFFGVAGEVRAESRTAEEQAQMILSTGMIYGQMAAENITQYIKNLNDASRINHGSQEIKDAIAEALLKAQDASVAMQKAIEISNKALSVIPPPQPAE